MAWLQSKRRVVSRGSLERAIATAVKSQCEGFGGVLVERIKPQPRTGANWTIRGIKFGTADRDKSRRVLSAVVEQMQREFDLDGHDSADPTEKVLIFTS